MFRGKVISYIVLPVKGKAIYMQAWGFQEVEAPRFQDNGHMKVLKLSAAFTPGNIPGIRLWWGVSRPQGLGATGPQCV